MSLDIHFHTRLLKRVKERQDSHSATLLSGHLDHLAYKRECGYLEALRDILEDCEGINKEIQEGK